MTNTPSPALAPTLADWLAASADVELLLTRLQAARQQALQTRELGLWIHVCGESAWREQLERLQLRLAATPDPAERLRRHPLLGVPFAVKDNIDVAGAPTTAACPAFEHLPAGHATVVQRLLDAGALWLGKTNLDQFATGLVGTRSPYGRPACVEDAARISGGSSSGSAVAVARGIVPFSLGTDTAGSGRVPAGFNGLVGLKPTPGRVSTAGVVPACRTLDCVSIFAHRVGDAEHVLSVIEGADAADPFSHFLPGPGRLPQRLRIGVPARPQLGAEYAGPWDQACARAAGLHAVTPMEFAPLHEVAALLYEGPWVAERHAACRDIFDRRPEAMDPVVRAVVGRAIGLTATDAFVAQYRLRALQARLASLWDQVDVLMVPTAPIHPTFAELDADPIGVNSRLGTYTNFVNLLGWSALSVPAGRSTAGLPFGVTFIGRAGLDAGLAELGRRWTGEADPAPALRRAAIEPVLPVAVVGAHLSGLPLNGQLTERGGVLLERTTTAPAYRLHALPGTVPLKPGLQRVREGGAAIELEVWALPQRSIGSFLALIPPPLGLGSIELADGRHVHGFLCEGHALEGAPDVSHFGGWRAYLSSLNPGA